MKKFLAALVTIALSCVSAFPQAYGTRSGAYFDPFPGGAAWTMRDALTGYTANFFVTSLANNTNYFCFTPAASSMFVDITIRKTVAATYPNPGLAQNEDLYIYKSAAWGPYIFEEILSQMGVSPPSYISTQYFYAQYANSPYGMMLVGSSSFWNSITESGQTNSCNPAPAPVANTWQTVLSSETRTTPVYAGPVNCATYTSISTTQNKEEWCFANDPKKRFPPALVEIDTVTENGSSVTIKMQTTVLTSFPRT